MANKNLSYFMREELKSEPVVSIPGPKTILDENGEVVIFQIKKLRPERVKEIYSRYKTTEVAMDRKRKQPFVQDGKVVMKETKDYDKAFRHLITEALVYPDLHDQSLMDYFDCVDVTDMPQKVFTSEEFSEVGKLVNKILGIGTNDDEQNESDIEEAKN